MEKFENKIIDMRDMYQERKEKCLPMMVQEESEHIIYLNSVCSARHGFLFYTSRMKHLMVGKAEGNIRGLMNGRWGVRPGMFD